MTPKSSVLSGFNVSMSSNYLLSIFLLSSGIEKGHWGLDPVNREVVPAQLFVY
jgi:hypothetical protein